MTENIRRFWDTPYTEQCRARTAVTYARDDAVHVWRLRILEIMGKLRRSDSASGFYERNNACAWPMPDARDTRPALSYGQMSPLI